MKSSKVLALAIFSLLLFQCNKATVNPLPLTATSAEVTAFLNEILDVMEAHSIKRDVIDWTDLRQQVVESAAGKQTIKSAYSSVQLALQLLDDRHSAMLTPEGDFIRGSESTCSATLFSNIPSFENIGYIRVPGFTGIDGEGVAFAEAIQEQIRQADQAGLKGWILDLRANTGGNMWAMLAGVGPILGEGLMGYFVTPDSSRTPWTYEDGKASYGYSEVIGVNDPYTPLNPFPKVAVLIDNYTASAGEAVCIAFKERGNTRSFGTPSCGLTTANAQYEVQNGEGEMLLLSIAYMADRTSRVFENALAPDQEIAGVDDVIQRAAAWVLEN